MKKVLIVAYYFPPLGGMGAQRTLRYIRHLPDFGWLPHVLTVKRAAKGEIIDKTLLADIPKGVEVLRTAFLDRTFVSRLFLKLSLERLAYYASRFMSYFPPDHCIGWLPFAYFKAKKLIADEQIDVIYTTSAPYTAHLIGYFLKGRTGKPWVADFRDEWTQNPFREPLFSWQRNVDLWLEQRVLSSADHVITVTEPYRAQMSSLLRPALRGKFATITNGFDADDFKTCCSSVAEKFNIAYSGVFYGAQQPTHFLSALENLVNHGKIPLDRIEIVFAGPARTWRPTTLSEVSPLNKVIKLTGYISHHEAIHYLMNSDVLMLIVSRLRGKGNIPGKTFEYIASGKPILALVPRDGAAAELLRRTKTKAVIVEPEDTSAIEGALLDLYVQWEKGKLKTKMDWDKIRMYEGRELTRKLCGILNRL